MNRFLFFYATALTYTYTLSLHDALPIFSAGQPGFRKFKFADTKTSGNPRLTFPRYIMIRRESLSRRADFLCAIRSEEHTSELQSPCNRVCRLLLENKKIG